MCALCACGPFIELTSRCWSESAQCTDSTTEKAREALIRMTFTHSGTAAGQVDPVASCVYTSVRPALCFGACLRINLVTQL